MFEVLLSSSYFGGGNVDADLAEHVLLFEDRMVSETVETVDLGDVAHVLQWLVPFG